MRIMPKMSERPPARRKSSAPQDTPLKSWLIQKSTRPSGDPQEPDGVAAEDPGLVGRPEARLLGDDVTRALVAHVEAEVASEHDAVGADGGDQIPQGLGRVADRVVGEAAEIRGDRPARAIASFGPHALTALEAPEEVRERTARVRQAHLELRAAIEDAAEDQVGGGDRGVEGIAE